uniref:Glutaredoxin domain-containing protein n=1 Tax=Chloropicon roscoffensis TaxID=1461544 RepID=A0A7S2X4E8_9CHLO
MVAAMTVQASGWSKGLQAKRPTAMVGNVGCGARRARSATGCQVRPLRWRREDRLEQAGGRRTATCEAQQGEAPGALTPELRAAVDRLVGENKIVLFMKGTKMFPQCGFSNTCVQIFNQLGAPFEDVNVLEDERIRTGMKEYSQWPTFPQVYIEGEFYGGCDILLESYQSGELEEYVERVLAS